ncbi:hypothetical protein [Clostridium sp.]|uniref:hypothetical protein n=1 Tax=Clostridium sp. TaxID=1506 RepID=UPI003217C7AA
MGIAVAIFVGFVTLILIILGISKIDKTSNQLMLLGIEFTVVGAVFLIMFYIFNCITLVWLGLALTVIGFIVNIFGFDKKQ